MYHAFLEFVCTSYFIPVHYKLNRIMSSTNRTSFIFLHKNFGLYSSLFQWVNSICFDSVNLALAVSFLPLSSDVVSVEFFGLCIFLRFPSQGNLVLHLRLFF